MTVNTSNKLAGHMKRTLLIVAVTTRRAESALATKSDELKIATVRATVHGTTIGRVTTMKHLVDIFDNRRAWMKLVYYFLIMVVKYVLQYVTHKAIMNN